MSRLPAATSTSDSLWVLGNSRRLSTEVGMTRWARWCAAAAVASLAGAPLYAQGSGGMADPAAPRAVVTNDMLLNAAGSGDWLMYGHNYWNNRFSPLKQINTTNVKNLVARAVYTHGSSTLGSFETTPIVVAGIMYITSPATPNNIVRAFDLRTQKMLWEYVHKNAPVSTACCGPNNRGVAVSGGSVFVATLDDELVALDATTGKGKWAGKGGDGVDRRDRCDQREVQVGLPGSAARRVGSGRREPARDRNGGRQEGRGRSGQDRIRVCARRGDRQAHPPLASVCAAAEHVHAAHGRRRVHASGRERRRRVVADRGASRPRVCIHGRAASANALQGALRTVGEG